MSSACAARSLSGFSVFRMTRKQEKNIRRKSQDVESSISPRSRLNRPKMSLSGQTMAMLQPVSLSGV